MSLISDLFLFAAALGAGVYCFILSRRLRALGDLQNGIGGAIASLSREVEDLTKVLETTKNAANTVSIGSEDRVKRSEAAARQLELLLASMHDLETPDQTAREAD